MTLLYCVKTRYVILLLTTLALTLVISNSLAFNFTVICMDNDMAVAENNPNATVYEVHKKSALLSGTAVGCLIGALPITFLMTRFGVRIMFTSYGLFSAVSILLTPLAYRFGFWPMIVARVLQGVPIAICFVGMVEFRLAAITSTWSPLTSTGLFLAFISCHMQFGPMFTTPVASLLCESELGWRSVYYLQGALSILVFGVFYLFYTDSPRAQKFISAAELSLIEHDKTVRSDDDQERDRVPYRRILADPVVWCILLSFTAGLLSFQLIMQMGPIYLNKVLKMDIKRTGISAALPFALSCLVKLVAGPLSDNISCLSERMRVIIFSSVSQMCMAACYVALALFPLNQMMLIQSAFTMVVVFSGLNTVGVVKAAQLYARFFAHVLMAWNTLIAGVIILILPIVIGLIAPDNTRPEWNIVFLSVAGFVVLSNVVFLVYIDVEPARWAARTAVSSELKAAQPLTLEEPKCDEDEPPLDPLTATSDNGHR